MTASIALLVFLLAYTLVIFGTFFRHLRWLPAIALGYAAAIAVHLMMN